ncbi:SLC13 family permease [Halanaerobium sp. MA284_MarDTE_T2]|uniref:SLC13 family permease n=1 Tax=Halanaerobium sp. MA284_MarDTE_T2 TaxID=2183913 RepID=UPI000DF4C45B|nr:SLC13 family permease [Halanaerobium sp. MA284_MarDTE_T2]RCW44383.1 di/tricarboxylate transporter [Halanaerobium sp. MA284_MarDTE_T2]
MLKHKRKLGLIIGIVTAVIIANGNFDGLSAEGQLCLAFSLMTVIFWATNVAHPGYTSGLYLILLVIFNVAPAENVFSLWSSSVIYLVMGAYLIAGSVESSGLGERIAYNYLLRFVSSYKSIIVSIFVLTFILSLLIPHPWPRAFLIMSVMAKIIKSANLNDSDSAKIGLTVFAASVPISMIFLTGDSTINIMAVEFSGMELSWFGWLYNMGIPAALASILTFFLIINLFKTEGKISFDREEIRKKLRGMGAVTPLEKKTILWISIAIIFWMTDSIHGIELGWVTLAVAMLMSFPIIGGVLKSDDWKQVPVHVLIFLTAAVSIGRIGGLTGMNAWISSAVLPETVPANLFLLAFMIAVVSILLHMVLGSVIAVMGIAIPAFLVFAEGSGLNPLVPALLV